MEDDQEQWYDGLLDWGKEQLGGIQGTAEIGGMDVTVGRLPGPSWPAVAIVAVLLLLIIVWRV